MSIANTIQSMEANISNAYDSAQQKGATIPSDKNLANLSLTIDSIPSSGSSSVEIPNVATADVPQYYSRDVNLLNLNTTFTYNLPSGIIIDYDATNTSGSYYGVYFYNYATKLQTKISNAGGISSTIQIGNKVLIFPKEKNSACEPLSLNVDDMTTKVIGSSSNIWAVNTMYYLDNIYVTIYNWSSGTRPANTYYYDETNDILVNANVPSINSVIYLCKFKDRYLLSSDGSVSSMWTGSLVRYDITNKTFKTLVSTNSGSSYFYFSKLIDDTYYFTYTSSNNWTYSGFYDYNDDTFNQFAMVINKLAHLKDNIYYLSNDTYGFQYDLDTHTQLTQANYFPLNVILENDWLIALKYYSTSIDNTLVISKTDLTTQSYISTGIQKMNVWCKDAGTYHGAAHNQYIYCTSTTNSSYYGIWRYYTGDGSVTQIITDSSPITGIFRINNRYFYYKSSDHTIYSFDSSGNTSAVYVVNTTQSNYSYTENSVLSPDNTNDYILIETYLPGLIYDYSTDTFSGLYLWNGSTSSLMTTTTLEYATTKISADLGMTVFGIDPNKKISPYSLNTTIRNAANIGLFVYDSENKYIRIGPYGQVSNYGKELTDLYFTPISGSKTIIPFVEKTIGLYKFYKENLSDNISSQYDFQISTNAAGRTLEITSKGHSPEFTLNPVVANNSQYKPMGMKIRWEISQNKVEVLSYLIDI